MVSKNDLQLIESSIRVINDWPEKGVIFRDITTLLQDPVAFNKVNEIFFERYNGQKIDVIGGIEARGLIFGSILAHQLGISFVPIRKLGKLPFQTYKESYTLEYGNITTIEVHTDAVSPKQRIVIVDDLIATGGSMLAACKLLKRLDADIYECAVVTDLLYLNGSKAIENAGFPVYSILAYNA